MQWIQQIEYGTNLTLFSLARLANALDVRLDAFLLPPRESSYVMKRGRPRTDRAIAAPMIATEGAKSPSRAASRRRSSKQR
jgi:hypothetical protein